jgi:SAM-dependent methyltransferase
LDSSAGTDLAERDLIAKTGLFPEQVVGKLVLDAGTGIGRHAEILARWGADVVAVDLSMSAEQAAQNLACCGNAVVLQADILDLPFRREKFDLIVSIGVIHHTPDPRRCVERLCALLRRGGELAVWAYAESFERRREWIPLTSALPRAAFRDWCTWMARLAREHRGNAWLEPIVRQFPFATHHPTLERTALALFDGYSPPYHSIHSSAEIVGWLRDCGFTDACAGDVAASGRGRKPV